MCHRDCLGACEEGPDHCDTCTRPSVKRCHCHDFHDSNCLDKPGAVLEKCVEEAMDEGCKRLDSTLLKSNVLFDPTTANKEMNRLHMDFVPRNWEERKQHNALIKEELLLRFNSTVKEGFNATMTQPHQVRKDRLN